MRRGTSFALTALLLVLLVVSVFAQVWALPLAVAHTVAVFPEVERLAVPSVIWGVVAIVCLQAVAVIGLRLVVLARHHLIDASANGWLRAIIGCLLAFIALVVAAFVTLNAVEYATPGVMLGLIAAGLLALIATGGLVLFLWARPTVRRPWRPQPTLYP